VSAFLTEQNILFAWEGTEGTHVLQIRQLPEYVPKNEYVVFWRGGGSYFRLPSFNSRKAAFGRHTVAGTAAAATECNQLCWTSIQACSDVGNKPGIESRHS